MTSNIEFMTRPYAVKKTVNVLNPTFKKWFFSRFKEFTEPQKYSIYTIHTRENILVSSPTGSGKTLSAFGAILNELVDLDEKDLLEDQIYCVYISPLKALSNDIEKNLLNPLEEIQALKGDDKLNLRVGVRTGDTLQKDKVKMAKNPPHIMITTPESLAIMLSSPKFREHFRKVQWCIIDEIHSLAENKRGVHLSLSMERLQDLSPSLTRVGLSATVSPLEDVANFLVGPKRKCKVVDVQFIKEYDFQVISPVDDFLNVSQHKLYDSLYRLLNKLIQSHKTTLVFTNTRSATERIVHNLRDMFPKLYKDNIEDEDIFSTIGAHHGSLSKKHRLDLENNLKEGKMKCVVCSTSLELGIDIGSIDLVICLGSPKSVARLLQRAGRAGHSLHKETKARIIVRDRDDLIECSVMLKSALDKKIDRIHIPTNCLDVLSQQIVGMVIDEERNVDDLYKMIRKSYCYANLERKDYDKVISYLAGEFVKLEERYVYAKIWKNDDGSLKRRGKMTRVIYMTNIGTIPDETAVKVKLGDAIIGTIEEGFLERLKPGDVFVLGGDIYQFRYSKGTTAFVKGSVSRPPTVPSWFSEQLPLSFDLANDIGKFRRLMEEHFDAKAKKADIVKFINDYLYVDTKAADAIYKYQKEQYDFCKILPSDKKILVEYYDDKEEKKIIFHTLFGRRVNDCLSRAIAFSLSLTQKRDVEVGISDNGFYIRSEKPVNVLAVLEQIKVDNIDKIMKHAIEKSEVLKRRFRHCASRSFMILRNYMGREKNVGRQQIASMILMKVLRELDPDFPILKEAKREVLEDSMDLDNTKEIIRRINDKEIQFEEIRTKIPSPFAFNLVLQGHLDILKMEDKIEFLKRMHSMVLAKISLSKKSGKNTTKNLLDDSEEILKELKAPDVDISKKLEEYRPHMREIQNRLLKRAGQIKRIPITFRKELFAIIKGKKIEDVSESFLEGIREHKDIIMKDWPKELADFALDFVNKREEFDIESYFDEREKDPNLKKALIKEEMIENIKKIIKRQDLSDELKYELIESIDGEIKLSKETDEWIDKFVNGTIPKYCSDELYFHLKELNKNKK